ncbi:hypothetical protein KIPB_010981 [Kipferlia bialata]|uniref:Uncharacterized protein n=1 Tax=Kipferlia bialata TaxID=797122 RepID=A0A9K3GNC1_9EUKA|nr:hypothetical protein KIPB_010981 [Kipferlia bialata]|eukprot:g10981.t1
MQPLPTSFPFSEWHTSSRGVLPDLQRRVHASQLVPLTDGRVVLVGKEAGVMDVVGEIPHRVFILSLVVEDSEGAIIAEEAPSPPPLAVSLSSRTHVGQRGRHYTNTAFTSGAGVVFAVTTVTYLEPNGYKMGYSDRKVDDMEINWLDLATLQWHRVERSDESSKCQYVGYMVPPKTRPVPRIDPVLYSEDNSLAFIGGKIEEECIPFGRDTLYLAPRQTFVHEIQSRRLRPLTLSLLHGLPVMLQMCQSPLGAVPRMAKTVYSWPEWVTGSSTVYRRGFMHPPYAVHLA